MISHVGRYGDSLVIRIPKPLAKDLGVRKGSAVDIRIKDNRLVIEVLENKPKLRGTAPKELLKFVGRLPKENFSEINKIIVEGCEQVDEDDW